MRRLLLSGVLLSSSVVLLGQQNSTSPQADGKGREPAVEQEKRIPPEHPVTAPKVICSGDQLSISADNSTLGNVLAEVRRCSGAQIDVPDAAAASRVFDQISLGPARQVLVSLLNATGFDYVISSSESSPDKIQTILLMARATTAPSNAASDRNMTSARRAFMQMRENARPKPPTTEGEAATNEPDTAASEAKASVQADSAEVRTDHQASADSGQNAIQATPAPADNPTQPPAEATPNSSRPKTTDEQITNMQQLFEQRRQMMQNANVPQQ